MYYSYDFQTIELVLVSEMGIIQIWRYVVTRLVKHIH